MAEEVFAGSVLSQTKSAFFDFDNTLTSYDVLDDIIEVFCENEEWRRFERLWQEGKIGSAECLKAQMGMVKAGPEALKAYLEEVKIDPYFKKLLLLFQEAGIKTTILSDSFSFFIKHILKANGLENIEVYANELEFSPEGLKAGFPYFSPSCGLCGHCKKNTLLSCRKGGKTIFVGDGRYDFCAAQAADFIFAKGDLASALRQKGVPFVNFYSLSDIYSCLSAYSR